MGILSDRDIGHLAEHEGMISPFVDHQVRTQGDRKIVSYGVGSYGYDIRCGNVFDVFTRAGRTGPGDNPYIVDPLNFETRHIMRKVGDYVLIPPNGFVLTSSLEYIKMPKDVTGIVLGKSTYARCGVDNLATPLEAGWCGNITLEFSNNTPCPIKMYANQGVAQVLFFKGTPCITTYADRGGKYQNQTGITYPRG